VDKKDIVNALKECLQTKEGQRILMAAMKDMVNDRGGMIISPPPEIDHHVQAQQLKQGKN
jgi:hypothetical protein